MRSRAVREGSVGLLVLAGLGLLAGVLAWIRGVSFGRRSYALEVELPDTLGLNVGSPVRFRGVKVGEVTALEAQTNGALLTVDIQSVTLLIPRDSQVEASESGFIGQVALEFRPQANTQPISVTDELTPFEPNCDRTLILCNGDRLGGQVGANFDDLIRATTTLATQLGEADLQQTLANLSTAARGVTQLSRTTRGTLKDVSVAAVGLSQLSRDARQQLQSVDGVTSSITRAADQVGRLGPKFSQTADQLGTAANEVTSLVQVNRGTLTATLNNLQVTSQDLKGVVNDLEPLIGRVERGKLIENLETLATNGAQASQNLNTLTTTLNNPTTLLGVSQTLDSARTTFQNTQKITTDLEQLTGNVEFRENLIKLINGLSKLVSSTQSLEQQLYAVKRHPPLNSVRQPGVLSTPHRPAQPSFPGRAEEP